MKKLKISKGALNGGLHRKRKTPCVALREAKKLLA
jgi:hypothetical protein